MSSRESRALTIAKLRAAGERWRQQAEVLIGKVAARDRQIGELRKALANTLDDALREEYAAMLRLSNERADAGAARYALFVHLHDNYQLTLVDSEIDAITEIVLRREQRERERMK